MEDLRSSKPKKTADPAVAQRVEKLLDNTQLSKDTDGIIMQIAFGRRVDADVALGRRGLGQTGARALATALKNSGQIRRLRLENNALDCKAARYIADGMKCVPNLEVLSLVGNHLGCEGAKAIAEGLAHTPKLRKLMLAANSIGREGGDAIVGALKQLHALQSIDLQNNPLGPQVMSSLATASQHIHSLRIIILGDELLGIEQAMQAKNALEMLPGIPCLNLFVSRIGPEAACVLGTAFSRSHEVTSIFEHKDDRAAFEAARPASTRRRGQKPRNSERPIPISPPPQRPSSSSATVAGLKRQLAAQEKKLKVAYEQIATKDKVLKESKALVQQLRDSNNSLRVEAAARDDIARQQAKQFKEKDALIQQLEARNEQMTRRLKMKDDSVLETHAESALNLNIPQSRFSDVTKARDQKGRVIRGSYGTLYTATLAGHCVALKHVDVDTRPRLAVILQASGSSSDEEHKRLSREALILLSIRHPNIVSFLGLSYNEHTQTLSFVLSWAEGGSLYEHLHVHGRQLTKSQCARIAMEVAGAVRFLHAHGIVHRDLKSPNVLLDGSLSAKVTDFGLSAFKRGDDKTLTHQKGTPLWASPEQLLELKLYADTDVFSFGVLYWELCFNCKPWHHGKYKGKGASVVVIANAYEKQKYLPVDGEINGVMLLAAEQQLLGGCFDVSGNRLDFTQLHTALREIYNAAAHHQQLDEKHQTKMLFGAEDAVWKFPPSLLEAVKAVTKQLSSRPSVSIAPLDLKRDVEAVKKLLTEAGGTTAEQPNALKPFGHTLAAVAITHDKQKEAAFNGALARNKTRYRGHLTSSSSHPFSPKYKHSTSTKEPTNEEEKQVLRRVTCGTTYNLLDPSLLQEDPPLRLQRVFHGVTSWKAVVGILGGDFANLQQLDGGWYGTGIYFTPDLDYALKYTRVYWKKEDAIHTVPPELQHLQLDASKEYRVVLACDVQYGNPYPVLDAVQFKGKPLAPAHDAHVVVVKAPKKAKLEDAVPFKSHTEWTKQGGGWRHPVAEIAMNDPSCILVRAMLVFEA